MLNEQNLLSEYQKYDYLNKDREHSLVKILVSYIKPSFLFKSEILTPIHLGRVVAKENSKDGVISDEDLNWLYENCIGDDDFMGNISNVNRRVGFLTGTWWAYKNYEKLGTPEYFGSFGYRRLLSPNFLPVLKNYDAILPKVIDFKLQTLKEQFVEYHGIELFDRMIHIIRLCKKSELTNFVNYINEAKGCFYEMYIFRKEIFFEFCNWIFPVIFELLKSSPIHLEGSEMRDIGFIAECLTGYYCSLINKRYKTLEVNVEYSEKLRVNPRNINSALLDKMRIVIRQK